MTTMPRGFDKWEPFDPNHLKWRANVILEITTELYHLILEPEDVTEAEFMMMDALRRLARDILKETRVLKLIRLEIELDSQLPSFDKLLERLENLHRDR